MKRAIAVMACLSLLGAVGCQRSIQGGGPVKAQEFKINVPITTVLIKQGETRTITISLDRGNHFKQDVQMTIIPPEGLSFQPTNFVIRASEPASVPVRLEAPLNTAIGEYKVRVIGQPQQGATASTDFTVKVESPQKS